MSLRPSVGDTVSSALQSALLSKAQDEDMMRRGVLETTERRQNRLLREGRAGGTYEMYFPLKLTLTPLF